MKDHTQWNANYLEFDFDDTWGFIGGENEDYPVLRAFYNDCDFIEPHVRSTQTAPVGEIEVFFNHTLQSTGELPMRWNLAGGSLPAGLVLANNGVITGTPSVSGTFEFTVRASNDYGSDTKEFSITVVRDITGSFSDANFLAAVRQKTGIDSGFISDADVSGLTDLAVNSRNIADLSGIEYFTALATLNCGDNQLTALDLSQNLALTTLRCGENQLMELDVSNNTALKTLYCDSNRLTQLDLSSNPDLTLLWCNFNSMDSTDDVVGWQTITGLILGNTFIFSPQNQKQDAATPSIVSQPTDATVYEGVAVDLTVTASVSQGSLSYQWYENTSKTNVGGTPIEDGTSRSYSVPTNTAGTKYYYCEVTNTDNTVTVNKTASINSSAVSVLVEELPLGIAVITLPTELGAKGYNVTIPLSIVNNPGIATFQMLITYDPTALTPVSVENGAVWNSGITKNLKYSVNEVFVAGSSSSLKDGDGNIANFVFSVNPAAEAGIYPISVEIIVLKTLDEQNTQQDIPYMSQNGSVEVVTIRKGDITGSGEVTAEDATEVLLHVAEKKILSYIQQIAADIYDKGKVSASDATEILLVAARLKEMPSSIAPALGMMSGFSVSSADDEVELTVGSVSGNPGVPITVPISITNNSGFSTFDFKIVYDTSRLTPVSVGKGSVWTDDYQSNLQGGDGEYILITGSSVDNFTSDGVIAFITFMIKEGSPAGPAYVRLEVQELCYTDEDYSVIDLEYSATNGGVNLTSTTTGVTITGRVNSYDPKKATTIMLCEGGTTDVVASTAISALSEGSGQITQAFSLEDISPGTYDLVATKGGHLSYQITGIVVGDAAVDLTVDTAKAYSIINLPTGDVNGDGTISTPDLTALLNNFGKPPTIDSFADVNGDGTVSTPDLTALLNNFGRKSENNTVQF